MNSLDKMEDYDRLSQELNKWKNRAIATKATNESLQAKLAMQAEALTHANRQPYPFGHLEMF